jgi:transcriptional regulator with XRE-family HTH domain
MKQGGIIREIRMKKGLTQQELADQCGLTLRTIQRIEHDEVKPSFHSLRRLEEVLGEAIPAEPVSSLPAAGGKVEVKLIITNMEQLVQDVKTLFRKNWKMLIGILLLIFIVANYREIKKGFMEGLDNSTVAVSTVNCGSERECDIEVVKMDANGKAVWKKILGGTSYDKAGSVVSTGDGGYLVVGSTSSFGNGNYDILLTRLSGDGNIIWQKNYGGFLNDYGLQVNLSDEEDVYEISGTQQVCSTPNVSDQCRDEAWTFRVDRNGKKIS